MPFVDGYPTESDIKPGLYILNPEQTHDFVQGGTVDIAYRFFGLLFDDRHNIFSPRAGRQNYVIERYTQEDYDYAWEFSTKLYEFLKYLNLLDRVTKKIGRVADASGLDFGNQFEGYETADNSLYTKDYVDFLTLNLPNTEDSEDWVTITYYETVPWIVENFWTYTSPSHFIAIDRVETLRTQASILNLEIPDSRTNTESTGSRIHLEVENPINDHYIQIDYDYRFSQRSTEGCLIDPFSRRYNLKNLRFPLRGQTIELDTRWLVGYTLVIDSNVSSAKEEIEAQIPEQYLFSNCQNYLDLLRAKIDLEYPLKLILSSYTQNINFNAPISLSNSMTLGTDPGTGQSTVIAIGTQNASVNYTQTSVAVTLEDINPDAHFVATLLYGNNNLYNNTFGDTSTSPDLGLPIHISLSRGNQFNHTLGSVNSIFEPFFNLGYSFEVANIDFELRSLTFDIPGTIPSYDIGEEENFGVICQLDVNDNYSFSSDQVFGYFYNHTAYGLDYYYLPFYDQTIYSSFTQPIKVWGNPLIANLTPTGQANTFEYFFVIAEGKKAFDWDNETAQDISFHQIISTNTPSGTNFSKLLSAAGRGFIGIDSPNEEYPKATYSNATQVTSSMLENGAVITNFNQTFNHDFSSTGSGVIRTTIVPRDLSFALANEETNISVFNTLYFEECSCMTQQIAQEILDLVREIHTSLNAGKFAYDDSGVNPRTANLGYYTERIARVLGISVNDDGSIRSIRNSKLITDAEILPAGWPLGQWGRNQGESETGQEGGLASEDRDGLAYSVRSNYFTEDQFTGQIDTVSEGGFVLVENIPQLIHILLDDLDRAFGLQNAGANVVPSPNGKLIPIEGMNSMLLHLLYSAGQISQSTVKTHISSLVTQAITKEILQGLGLPIDLKTLDLKIDSQQSASVVIPGFGNRAPSLMDLHLLTMLNIGALLESKIDVTEGNNS